MFKVHLFQMNVLKVGGFFELKACTCNLDLGLNKKNKQVTSHSST